MSDDTTDRDERKGDHTGIAAASKAAIRRLVPGSTGGSETTRGSVDGALDRRTYLLLTGGVASGALAGTLDGSPGPASAADVSQPDLYGYGGRTGVDGTERMVTSSVTADTLTQTGENEERETAMEITTGTLVEAELDPGTVDWFVFGTTEGDPITVDFDRVPDVGVTGLMLYGPDGSFEEKLYVGTGNQTQLSHTAQTTGNYFLQVVDVEDSDGAYSFTVWLQEEPDDGSSDTEQAPYGGTLRPVPGRIQAQDFDDGGQDVAYYDTTDQNQGGEYRTDEYVDIELSEDSTNEYSVGYTEAGEWLEYTVDVTPGIYDLDVRVATDLTDQQLTVTLGGETVGTVDVPATGGWHSWETVSLTDVEIDQTGEQVLRVEFPTSEVNVNWLQFAGQTPYSGSVRTIPGRIQAEEFDNGGQDVAYYDTSSQNKGGEYRPDEYVDIEQSKDSTNEYSVGYTEAGEWLEYTVDVTPDTYTLRARVATNKKNRQLDVVLGGQTLGTIDVAKTGGWYSWETVSLAGIEIGADGLELLRLEFVESGLNVNWIELVAETDDSYGTQTYGEYGYGGTTE